MSDTVVEYISDSDKLLMSNMKMNVQTTQRLQAFVIDHLVQMYKLEQGDIINDDGSIKRIERITE